MIGPRNPLDGDLPATAPKPAVGALGMLGLQPQVVQAPHPNYSLSEAPQFLRDALPMNQFKVEQGNPDAMTGLGAEHHHATAYVSPKAPNTIEVLDPNTFKQAQLNHELTHSYEHGPLGKTQFAPENPSNLYDYGGMKGLTRDANPQHYSDEQLARIVEQQSDRTARLRDLISSGKAYQEDIDEYNRWNQAAAPLIHSFAAAGGHSYPAYSPQPGTVADLPEMSGWTAPVPAGIGHRPAPPQFDPKKVNTGVF